MTRLLGDDAISFVFRDEGGRSVVHLSDALEGGELATPALPYAEDATTVGGRRHATAVSRSGAPRPGAITLQDFDHLRPGFPVSASVRSGEPGGASRDHRREIHGYLPGGALAHGATPDPSMPLADSRGAPRHSGEHLRARAARELSRSRADRRVVRFTTNVAEVRAGAVVALAGHPRRELEARLLVTSSRLQTGLHSPGAILAKAVFADEPHVPPRTVQRPRVWGLQSALVVGPSGDGVHTDEHGRVSVQFPWDRGGTGGGGGSTWVRVSHGWAGGGYGLFTLPRVGHEVLVAFLDGDPDHPIVVGSLHNGVNRPPYRLPEGKTISTFRTASTPGGGGWNELRFDDQLGAEQIFLRAERDMETHVQAAHALHVGASSTTTVRGAASTMIGIDRSAVIAGLERLEVGGDRATHVRGSSRDVVTGERLEVTQGASREEYGGIRDLSARQDVIERVEGNRVLVVGQASAERSFATHVEGDLRTTVTERIELRADRELLLVCGRSSIRLSPDRVEVRSPEVALHGEDARLRLAEGALKGKAKTRAQLLSDEIVLKSEGASLGLFDDASLAGAKVKLGASSDADDSADDEREPPTVLELVDESGEPIPGQPFRVILESGREISGVLDARGRAELELSEPCEVVFPGMPQARRE